MIISVSQSPNTGTRLYAYDPSNAEACDDCPQGYINWYDILAWLNVLSRAAGLEECYDLSDCSGTPASGCPGGDWYQTGCDWNPDTKKLLPDLYRCNNVHRYPKRVDCPGYRLPTEAEWEWAARAGTTAATYNGELPDGDETCETYGLVLDPIAWTPCNADPSDLRLKPVAQLQPNAYGLFDVVGNACEYVDGIYTGAGLLENCGGGELPLVDPVGYTVEEGNSTRVCRGGGIAHAPCYNTCSVNGQASDYTRAYDVVFRPVRTLFE